MGVEGRRSTVRQHKRKNILTCCFLAALLWSTLLWRGLFHLQGAPVPSIQIDLLEGSRSSSSGSPNDKSSNLCSSFLSNIAPTYRFFPQRFFQQGGGRPFLPIYEHNRDNFTDILNARFLVFRQSNDCSIVHYHIHKNGGTTLERHVPLATDNYYSKREKEMGHKAFEAACAKVMEEVWQQQQQQSTIQSVRTFTFLRDPVHRFLSSVAQVLKLREWHTRLYPCYERNSTEALLDCVLDMLETGTFPEMHLSPQAFELYKQVMGHDIFIEVLDLSQIGLVMEQLGAGQIPKERSTTGSLIRRFPSFRLTMDALDPKRIERICKIYAVDVKMIHETKVTKTICPDLAVAGR